ncbi:MAG: dephospho-CoA kinase [Proteobacteria bacterium]|nr:dephospho-CoA kinase [Pseudomonadota bacterium]MDA1132083.1 dephospho-CoA kinase [Pseudomonadota bacterium]
MIVLGLTGSVAMGKSTAAAALAERGFPVFEADAAVHRLLGPGGDAVAEVAAAFPDSAGNETIDRSALGDRVLGDAAALDRLEAILHPRVDAVATAFLHRAQADGAPLAVLEMPLLFEIGAERLCDAVVVVHAPEEAQRRRALARPGMTPERLAFVLSRQVPDAEKRRRADYVVDSGDGIPKMSLELARITDSLLADARTR